MAPVSKTLRDLYARFQGHNIIKRKNNSQMVQDRAIGTTEWLLYDLKNWGTADWLPSLLNQQVITAWRMKPTQLLPLHTAVTNIAGE